LAFSASAHFGAGTGGFQRKSPTGAAAKGIPLKEVTVEFSLDTPFTPPVSIWTTTWGKEVAWSREVPEISIAISTEAKEEDLALDWTDLTRTDMITGEFLHGCGFVGSYCCRIAVPYIPTELDA
jgi:hypothetical protein